MAGVDWLVAHWPRREPPLSVLSDCKIVAHRGEHASGVLENTLDAFRLAETAGVWGIECDIHWTRDGVAVVHHDQDCRRVFHSPLRIDQVEFAQLRAEIPQIPSLEELLTEFQGKLHFMLELKAIPPDDAAHEAFEGLLSTLVPARDFHLLSLNPELFRPMDFVPAESLLPVAELNVAQLSHLALEQGWAGISGHYALLSGARLAKHQQNGQQVGTGFSDSKRALYREIARGADWVFSNRAVEMQAEVDRLLHIVEGHIP